jgi:protocatechuate 3,4-dioxygenase beta subunit
MRQPGTLKVRGDDQHVGGLVTRRELVTRWRAVAAAAVTGHERSAAAEPVAAPDCLAQPQQTEGPYPVDERLARPDIRVDPVTGTVSAGIPLQLRLVLTQVTAAGTYEVLPGAQVEIWHCDAAGTCGDVRDPGSDSTVRTWLRGHQTSDAAGEVRFTTIYPGWYPGRAVHIQFSVRRPAANGRVDEFTSSLYFDDGVTDRVHSAAPYAARRGQRLLNERDMIFRERGTRLILPVVEADEGYSATYRVAMRPAAA